MAYAFIFLREIYEYDYWVKVDEQFSTINIYYNMISKIAILIYMVCEVYRCTCFLTTLLEIVIVIFKAFL